MTSVTYIDINSQCYIYSNNRVLLPYNHQITQISALNIITHHLNWWIRPLDNLQGWSSTLGALCSWKTMLTLGFKLLVWVTGLLGSLSNAEQTCQPAHRKYMIIVSSKGNQDHFTQRFSLQLVLIPGSAVMWPSVLLLRLALPFLVDLRTWSLMDMLRQLLGRLDTACTLPQRCSPGWKSTSAITSLFTPSTLPCAGMATIGVSPKSWMWSNMFLGNYRVGLQRMLFGCFKRSVTEIWRFALVTMRMNLREIVCVLNMMDPLRCNATCAVRNLSAADLSGSDGTLCTRTSSMFVRWKLLNVSLFWAFRIVITYDVTSCLWNFDQAIQNAQSLGLVKWIHSTIDGSHMTVPAQPLWFGTIAKQECHVRKSSHLSPLPLPKSLLRLSLETFQPGNLP